MTSFIKSKFTKSDEQTNIDKYRVAANITEYHIMLKLIFLRIIIPNFNIIELLHILSVPNCMMILHTEFEFVRTINILFMIYIRNHAEFEIDRTILTYRN